MNINDIVPIPLIFSNAKRAYATCSPDGQVVSIYDKLQLGVTHEVAIDKDRTILAVLEEYEPYKLIQTLDGENYF